MQEQGIQLFACGAVGLVVSLLLASLIIRWRNRKTEQESPGSEVRSPASEVGDRRSGIRRRPAEFHHTGGGNGIPRLGGICIVGGFLVVCAVAGLQTHFAAMERSRFWMMVGSALAMFLVGIIDDFRPLGAKRKLILQILVASGAYYCGIQINLLKNPFTGEVFQFGGFGFVITVLWLVAMTNLINLIDGIDGLAGGIGIMLMGLLAWVGRDVGDGFYSLLCVGLIGSLLGFLRHNFPPAKIYMGDGGAYFLGFFIGVFSIETSNKGTVLAALSAPALALALPIIDTTLALLRRGIKGLPLFRPDMEHIHHKLMRKGVTRKRAVITLYLFSVVSLCIAVGIFVLAGNQVPVFVGFAALGLIVLLHYLKVIPEFWTVGTVIKESWKLRWRSRYILTMSSWLEVEAERCQSVGELWRSYSFFLERLDLVRVTVHLDGLERTWHSGERSDTLREVRHRFGAEENCAIEFYCAEERLSRREFDHVTDLAAETWLKALTRWEEAHQRVGRFAERAPHVDKNRPLAIEGDG